MYTLTDLTKVQQDEVTKLPETSRQVIIDLFGAANAKAESERTELEVVLNENNADGKPAKGAVQVYGLGRFPVSLRIEQWRRLIGFISTIQAFIDSPVNQEKAKLIQARYREYEKSLKAKDQPALSVAK